MNDVNTEQLHEWRGAVSPPDVSTKILHEWLGAVGPTLVKSYYMSGGVQ